MAQAEKYLKSALRISSEINETPMRLNILLHIAELRIQKGEKEQVESLLSIASKHSASEQHVVEKAIQLIEDYDGTFTSAPPHSLDEIIEEVLAS